MKGRTVCYHHGGKTPRGMAHPSYKGKGYSQDLPANLAAVYDQEDQAERQRLDHEITLLNTRIRELVQRLTTGERGTVWDDLQATVNHLAEAITASQNDASRLQFVTETIPQLQAIAAKGKATEQAWRDIGAEIERKARITTAEAKRRHDAGEIATREQVQTLLVAIVHTIRTHVTDKDTLQAISHDIGRLVHSTTTPP